MSSSRGRLDGVARDGHRGRLLEAGHAAAHVVHADRAAGAVIDLDAGDHRVGPDLGAAGQRVRDVGDQRGRLGVDLAALQAEPAVDAVRPVAEPAVGDGHRADPGLDAGLAGAAQEHLAVAAHRVRPVRVGVRVAPRPVLAGDRQLLLDLLVVGPQVGVADRPVRADPVVGPGGEVTGVEPRRVAGVVHHRPAHAPARVVRAERHRVSAVDHPRLGPVQVVRARLVADPVGVGIPERPGVQRDDPPAPAGHPLRERGPARAAAHDGQVDLVAVGEPAHVAAQLVVGAGAVVGQQPGRLVPCVARTAAS